MTTLDLSRTLEAERTEAARRRDHWLVDRLTAALAALRQHKKHDDA